MILIILGILVYLFIAMLYLVLAMKYNNIANIFEDADEAAWVPIALVWPISIPITLAVLFCMFCYRILSKLLLSKS